MRRRRVFSACSAFLRAAAAQTQLPGSNCAPRAGPTAGPRGEKTRHPSADCGPARRASNSAADRPRGAGPCTCAVRAPATTAPTVAGLARLKQVPPPRRRHGWTKRGRTSCRVPAPMPTISATRPSTRCLRGRTRRSTRCSCSCPASHRIRSPSGSFHIRNEHENVQYRINGVFLPPGVAGFGQMIETSFVGNLALLDGALPAQYGLRTAGIIDITSRAGASTMAGASESMAAARRR